jgi:hypothetical protein
MHMRRFTRLTNALSKKVENHAYAVALHMMYYNFVKIHTKLRTSPAMAAGVSDRLWEIADIVALWEAVEPNKTAYSTTSRFRRSYKARIIQETDGNRGGGGMTKAALILAAAIVIGGFLAGGRYTSSSEQGYAYITDRFTGATWKCSPVECIKVGKQNSD